MVLAQLGKPLHSALLSRERRFVGLPALEPVVVVGEVDDDIRTVVVEQLGKTGGIPALAGGRGARKPMSSSAPRRMSAWPRALPPPNSIRRIRIQETLEGDVVIEAVIVRRWLLPRGRLLRLSLLTRSLLRLALRARLTWRVIGTAATTAEQLHGAIHVDDDFGGVALDAILSHSRVCRRPSM